nr:MAG TPA: hypothetical protein [Caudoviricetes sp.]
MAWVECIYTGWKLYVMRFPCSFSNNSALRLN